MRATSPSPELMRSSLSVLFMVGLIAASFWILRPFLPAVLWATMIAVAAWPLMLKVEALLWGRRWVAVTVMTLSILLVFAVPFLLAIGTLVTHLPQILSLSQSPYPFHIPVPPHS